MALKICFKIRKYEKKMLLLPRLDPQTLRTVVLNANHYTRTDDKNNDEIITINDKKIWSKSLNIVLVQIIDCNSSI